MVGADVEFPRVPRRIATLRGIFHHYPLRGTVPQREFMHALIGDFGAAVPGNMQHEEQHIIIVAKSRIDFILHEVGLAAELRAQIRHLHRRAVFIFACVGNQVRLGFPFPAANKVQPGEFEKDDVCFVPIADMRISVSATKMAQNRT